MDVGLVLLAVGAFFLVAALCEVPIGIAVGLSGAVGITLVSGAEVAGNVIGAAAYSSAANYSLLVIPMYVLMGSLISNSGIGSGIYRVCNRLVRRIPAGLPVSTVIATGLFSGVSGSSAADVAVIGRVSVTEMSRFGYSRSYAAAVVATAGAFAALIPPGVMIVIYAITADVSIGTTILAAVIPGVLSVAVLAVWLVVSEVLRPVSAFRSTDGPARRRTDAALPEPTAKDRLGTKPGDVTAVLWALLIFAIVVGGLYGGFFTATEAGAIAAFVALLVGVASRRPEGLRPGPLLGRSLREAASVTSMIFLLVLGGSVFSYFIASSGLASDITDWVTGLDVPPKVIVAVFLLAMLPLGMFLDGLTIVVLTVPLIAPIVAELGMNEIWFGVLMLKMVEVALLTPPVGINAYIISSLVGIRVEPVFRRLAPFVMLDLCVTSAIFLVPDIALWLPRVMDVA